ncbi:MAG: carbamoyltransferase HypF [Pirellulales bacterium]|nr:carbamoyltransferase HypF [Pirellulales bacterium]
MGKRDASPPLGRWRIAVRGIVQGVGFRPFVYNAARARGLSGWVANEADTVQIEVQGEPAALDDFLKTLESTPPPRARIDAIHREAVAVVENARASFEICASTAHSAPGPAIPADLATCEACLAEIESARERRHRYPFTNCTNCGPRWSIIQGLPYDRPRTSMARFEMCPDCRAEYSDPADRRFHAQPIACPRCGPRLRLLDALGAELADGDAALRQCAEAIRAGRIAALKGLGGFQLVVDALDESAVARLRDRKRRPDRPFALMMASLDDVRRCCHVSSAEANLLAAPEAPILLLRRRDDGPGVAPAVAPGNPYLGVMLPYTPLHHLLMAAVARPVVCTSGNLSEEPMATATQDALARLGSIADVFLTHNRPIVRPVDDSVGWVDDDGLRLVRRARGFAPLPVALARPGPTVLAVGGHLKNTVALALEHHAVLSAHVGDLESPASREVHQRAVEDLVGFFQATPERVACDLHPDYASTRLAESLAAAWNVPLIRVQHHHAHVAACMAEHGLDGAVLGLAWDGTGYGADGTVWGGEALVCEGTGFTRLAHPRTFRLPGGDRAVREPRRSALGVLFEIDPDTARRHAAAWFTPAELDTLLSMLRQGSSSPLTSSLGRLFDAVAALCGLAPVISFEGQAAMALEFAVDPQHQEAYPLPLDESGSPVGPRVADWRPLVEAVLADRAAGVSVGRIAARFHNALAELALAIARGAGISRVVLGGGCFQNRLLAARARTRLSEAGFNVYNPRGVPPGDGGIALGQVWLARQN